MRMATWDIDGVRDRAKSRIGQSTKDMESLIASLTENAKRAEADAAEAAERLAEAEARAKTLAEQESLLAEKKHEILEKVSIQTSSE